MKRIIVKIDEELCNGCGICIKGCHEGALQLINEKAIMISDLYCDGLGACLGDCPVGAICLEEREALPYDEIAVMERLEPKGKDVIKAHLRHLEEHGELGFFKQGLDYLKQKGISIDIQSLAKKRKSLKTEKKEALKPVKLGPDSGPQREFHLNSELKQFPIQLHLISPSADVFQASDLLLAADCAAFASANFHNEYLKGHSLAIACPKLDQNLEVYIEKLEVLIREAKIKSLSVLMMEVPCCAGLLRIASTAREKSKRDLPIKAISLTRTGELKKIEWI